MKLQEIFITDECDVAVLISGDTDLAPSVRMARKLFSTEIHFLGANLSPAFVRSPECNGSAERFFRTLKENLLWVREFEDLEELNQALQEFKNLYNNHWLIGRHNYKTPSQVKEQCLASSKEAA